MSGSLAFVFFLGGAVGSESSVSTSVDLADRFLVEDDDEPFEVGRGVAEEEGFSSTSSVSSLVPFFRKPPRAGSAATSSSASDDFCDRFFVEEEVPLPVVFALGVGVASAAGSGVVFARDEPDFFFDSAPAAISTKLRNKAKNVRALRIMKLRNNQNLSGSDSVLAAQLDVICIKNICGTRF